MKDKMYLVVNNWSEEDSGNVDMETFMLFSKIEDARCYFNEKKEEIINNNYGYDNIEEEEDYYCESVNGEYLYYHDLVYIREIEVN